MSSFGSQTIPTLLSITFTNDSSSTSTGSLIVSGGVGIAKNLSGSTISLTGALTSTVSTGSAPFVVSSTTNVGNLNCSFLNGSTFASPGAIGSTVASSGAFSTISATGAITSTVSTGSPPFVVSSTTNVGNLNCSFLNGSTFASPSSIGSTVASSGAFTTISATGIITSTMSSGTAPFSITSTTVVPNLNVNFLNGSTFAIPSAIGSTTPNAGSFTTLSASNVITSTVSTGTAPFTIASQTNIANLNASSLNGATFASPGPIGSSTASTGSFSSLTITGNTSSNNFISGYATTATSGSTTTLTVNSAEHQFFTGSTTHTVVLPVVSTLSLGFSFTIVNNSSLSVTVQSSGTNVIQIMATGTSLVLTCILITGTTGTSWFANYQITTETTFTGDSVVFNNSLSVGGITASLASHAANLVLVSPNGSAGTPTFRSLVNADLPSAVSFSTISASGVISSTLSIGTAPFSITSTTVVPNLNVSFLNGSTFASPGAIGSTTAGTGAFSTLSTSGVLSANNTTDASSISTGSIISLGGVGITKSLYVGLNAYSTNFVDGFTTTATAASTTTLTVSSTCQQYFTGSVTQTVVLPVVSTLTLGFQFIIVNNSSGVVTVQSSGSNVVQAMAANTSLNVTCILITGTTNASWSSSYQVSSLTSFTGDSVVFNNSASVGAITATLATHTTNQVLASPNGSTGTPTFRSLVNSDLPSAVSFSTISASNVITSTLASGTAPFSITSTTVVPNLNVSLLNGFTFSNPGSIGSGTAATTISASGIVSFTNATASTSKTSGALVVTGGIGLSGALYGSTAFFSGAVDIGSNTITSLATPVNGTDAANKNYVDSIAQGLSVKYSVVAASTGSNITLSTIVPTFVLDGVTLATGNRVLIKDQTTATQNGVYVVQSSGSPIRSTDFAAGANASGYFVFVEAGTVNIASGWVESNSTNDIVGTANLIFTQFSGAGEVVAGSGLSKSANTLSVVVDNSSLEINANALRIKSAALGTGLSGGSGTSISVNASQTQITAVGTLTTGTWNATTIAVGNGGTGQTTFTSGQILFGNGTSGLNTSSNMIFNGTTFTVGNTTDSSSTTTGSLIVSGGVGIAKNLNVGGTLVVSNTTGVTTLNVTGTLNALLTTDSSSSITGSVIVSGGIGIAKSLWIGTTLNITGQITSTVSTGTAPLVIASTTNIPNLNASSINGFTFPNPGSIGNTTPATTIAASGVVTLSNATASTSSSTGALVVTSGGIAVGITTDATSSTNGGSLTVAGGAAIAKSAQIGTTLSVTNGITINGFVKNYQSSGSFSTAGVFVLNIAAGSGYHIKVRAMLNETSNSQNSSILTVEGQGKSTSSCFIWNTQVSNQSNAFPWSSTVTGSASVSTSHTITFQPINGTRTYNYFIVIDLFNSSASLSSITLDASTVNTYSY